MAATDLRRLVLRVAQLVRRLSPRRTQAVQAAGLLGGALASGMASAAANLPEDKADAMIHVYDGGGMRASGPALLVRKKVGDSLSLSGSYYIDMVSNASIDVVTTASPYKETRKEYILGADYAVRDAIVSVSTSNSDEPDYEAKATSIDVTQDVFGGMTSLSIGFTRGDDRVGRHNEGFFDKATHWRWRFGATQILSPTWLTSFNYEAIADDGFLGSAYRQARVFGATVPERNPRTRSSRSMQFRTLNEVSPGHAVRFDYRYFWDNWAIRSHTFELRYSRTFTEPWLVDWYGRYYTQSKALFYSDNATVDTTYVSRNRQLSTFKTMALGARMSYSAKRVPGQYELKLNAAVEQVMFKYSDFTDIRTGQPYKHDATVFQLSVSATF